MAEQERDGSDHGKTSRGAGSGKKVNRLSLKAKAFLEILFKRDVHQSVPTYRQAAICNCSTQAVNYHRRKFRDQGLMGAREPLALGDSSSNTTSGSAQRQQEGRDPGSPQVGISAHRSKFDGWPTCLTDTDKEFIEEVINHICAISINELQARFTEFRSAQALLPEYNISG